jgi:hypothetical protein
MPTVMARMWAVGAAFGLLAFFAISTRVSLNEGMAAPKALVSAGAGGLAEAGPDESRRAAGIAGADAAARGEHVVWNAGCWLLGLGLLVAGRRNERRAASTHGLREAADMSQAGLAFRAAGSRSYRR